MLVKLSQSCNTGPHLCVVGSGCLPGCTGLVDQGDGEDNFDDEGIPITASNGAILND